MLIDYGSSSPAQAGIPIGRSNNYNRWIPAYAGMTVKLGMTVQSENDSSV
jgi:hypothetical protein